MSECERLSGNTPLDRPILLWFIGNNAPKAAHTWTIGQVSSYQPGSIWDGRAYRPVEWFTHWMPMPKAPADDSP